MKASQLSEPCWSIGLMTGTVLDGNIDIAMLRTDGEEVVEFGPSVLARYEPSVNQLLQESLQAALDWQFDGPEPDVFRCAEHALTEAQSAAIIKLLDESGMAAGDIGVIGFHGQTVLHRRPSADLCGRTRQLGDGQLMANLTGIPVAFDFRNNDVSAGGQGAPLAPVYHAALIHRLGFGEDTAILNLGGVANITAMHDGVLYAFDTGPANAPLNDFVRKHANVPMDTGGQVAARGIVDEVKLQALLQHPYFDEPFPKSLDRFDFSAVMAEGCNLADGAALLTAFSAAAVGKGLDLLPKRPSQLVVCGGGRHNPTLMRELVQRADVAILQADEIGLRGDMVEAECFAFLALRTLRKLPISFPTTTGVSTALTGGRLMMPG